RILLLTTRPEDLPDPITHALWLEGCRVKAAGAKDEVLKSIRKRRGGRSQSGRSRFLQSRKEGVRTREETNLALPLIELRNVTVRYGDSTILRNINWTVNAGQSWALLGPNGSGKTTLLSLILGDNPQAYSNHVVVFGKPRGQGDSVWELK